MNGALQLVESKTCADSFQQTIEGISHRLLRNTAEGRSILLLVSGGQPLAAVVQALAGLTAEQLSYITVAQLDEAYGPVEHDKSNWVQLKHSFGGLAACKRIMPILHEGSTFSETVNNYDFELTTIIKQSDYSLAVLGIEEDGSIVGMRPQSAQDFQIFFNDDFITGHIYGEDRCVTITDYGLRVLSDIVVFACDDSGSGPLAKLAKHTPVHRFPAQLLKIYDRVTLYTKQAS